MKLPQRSTTSSLWCSCALAGRSAKRQRIGVTKNHGRSAAARMCSTSRKRTLRHATISARPVTSAAKSRPSGSASQTHVRVAGMKNKGVQPLLDAVIDYLPSPLDVPPVQGIDPKTEQEIERPASMEAPFSALAFKVMSDPFVGKLTYFRVYS